MVACHRKLVACWYYGWSLVIVVRADANLAKDVLTCHLLVRSLYKSHHPNNTDEPDVGGSSEDEAEGMEEVLGVTRRLYKPLPAQPSLAQPSPEAPEDRDTVRVPRKDLKRVAKLLQDLSAGKKVKLPVSTSREEVPFAVPDVMAGETNCALCHQTFKSTRSLRRHMKTHTGETGYSCQCGKVLASRIMLDLHQKSCGRDKSHLCKACNLGCTTKQALVHHLKAKHGPDPTKEELTCATCGKEFKLVKTMREHMAVTRVCFTVAFQGAEQVPLTSQSVSTGIWPRNMILRLTRSEFGLAVFIRKSDLVACIIF